MSEPHDVPPTAAPDPHGTRYEDVSPDSAMPALIPSAATQDTAAVRSDFESTVPSVVKISRPETGASATHYAAGDVQRAFVETVAVGDVLPDMPLFLDPDTYVNVPLEATDRSAWEAVPLPWRRELEP